MKRAIILMNMGGPNNLDEVDVFLKNMFNDKYIIGAPQPIRALIGYIIRKKRLKEAQHNYSLLGGISPIVGHTKRLCRRLAKKVDADVFYEMRYTPPFASEVLEKVKNYDKIYAIPMYPHYSQTTTRSSIEDLMDEAKKLQIDHKIVTLDHYYDNENYNKAIVERIKETIPKDQDSKEFHLVFSAHGLTQKLIDKGDLYQDHIIKNVECAKQQLQAQGIEFKQIHLAYQSRLGPMEWLRPYLEDELASIGEGQKVLIYPIAFTVDNSETECELDIEYKEVALDLGINEYFVAKAPNHHPLFVDTLVELYEGLKRKYS